MRQTAEQTQEDIMRNNLMRPMSVILFFILGLLPAQAEENTSTTTPVQMTLTLRVQGKNKRMPEVTHDDIIVRQGKERLK